LIVDAFFKMSVFSFIALTFNTLQGFFVFISFVCNKRVLFLYKSCIFGERLHNTTWSWKQPHFKQSTAFIFC
jgi:hypothetical protein